MLCNTSEKASSAIVLAGVIFAVMLALFVLYKLRHWIGKLTLLNKMHEKVAKYRVKAKIVVSCACVCLRDTSPR
jgi:hypothetical protein